MPSKILDFRSDTVTRPTPEMRDAMARAEVGDDVYGDDPSVNRLQERLAELLGKQAALFVPTGTMSNQIGLRVHCAPGDEFLCESGCHIYNYEQGAYAQLSGLAVRPIDGVSGVLTLDQMTGAIRPDNPHCVRTRLLCLENTHNRGGGRVLPYEGVVELCAWAHSHGLATHLDGARLFNAVVASGISAEVWARSFDTVSVCFSKGLGAPVGSALAGPRALIDRALRHRKVFGGAMRQAGVLAAAAHYALDHHIARLAEDHAHAKWLASEIASIEGLTLKPALVDTNLVIFAVDARLGTSRDFAARLAQQGLLVTTFGDQMVRAVTHLDVSQADCKRAAEILRETAKTSGGAAPIEPQSSIYA
jgi:threonine aldolase